MEDDSEKSLGKPESLPPDESILLDDSELVNETSNGLIDESLMLSEETPPPFAPEESDSQMFPTATFDCGDDSVSFQDNFTNDGESMDTPQITNDGDFSNPLCQESAANPQNVPQEIKSNLDSLDAPDYTSKNVIAHNSDRDESKKQPETENKEPTKEEQVAAKTVNISENKSTVPMEEESELLSDKVPAHEKHGEILDENVEDKKVVAPCEDTQNISDEAFEPIADVEMKPVEEVKPVEVKPVEEVKPDEVAVTKKKISSVRQEADTEVVSEDELPAVEKPRVQDAENVSDDELPGPKPAELPADTEVVSEDELPSTRREDKQDDTASTESGGRKRKPNDGAHSPVSDSDPSSKKQAVTKNGESKPVPAEKRASEEKEKKKKPLPELDKYWKVVNEDSSDFTGWTYLLQYVDQENDPDAAREAYDAFLSHYPYCYGYWRKYADYEKRKGSKKKCYEVLERGLKAIPLSVDLWIHFLNHIKNTKSEDLAYVRQQYDRAIEACGLEFRSDRLWESYIKWETEHGTPLHVTNVYDRLLATPTLGYTSHFDSFQEHVMSESVSAVVSREELVRVRAEVREGNTVPPVPSDLPPGEDEPDDHIASEEEGQAIKERVIAARRKVHKATGEQVAQRWTFEEGIKRPYFHVKPLERSQLKNWKNYLEWEKQHGSFRRALVLHERCLIACALYEEFWLRLVKFLEEASQTDSGLVAVEREALERACTVHHPDKPALHLHWAYFEEVNGNTTRAAEILERLDKTCPNLLQVAYRRINLERRRGDLDKCVQLYESYIASSKNKAIASALSIKYARFLMRWRNDAAGAQKVLADAIVKDPLAHRLYLQQLDIALHTPDSTFAQMSGYLDAYERVEGADLDMVGAMAARRMELAEEMGTAVEARAAYNHHRAVDRKLSKRARQNKHEPALPPEPAPPKKKEAQPLMNANNAPMSGPPQMNTGPPPGPGGNMGPHGGPYYPPNATGPPQPYDQPPYQQQYQPQWNHYQQHPPNPYHPNPWGQYPNYY